MTIEEAIRRSVHERIHAGTKQEHSHVLASIDHRSPFNFCSLCNEWFYRNDPRHDYSEST